MCFGLDPVPVIHTTDMLNVAYVMALTAVSIADLKDKLTHLCNVLHSLTAVSWSQTNGTEAPMRTSIKHFSALAVLAASSGFGQGTEMTSPFPRRVLGTGFA